MATATKRSLEYRHLLRELAKLLDLSLELDPRASKIMGQGWTATRYLADGKPGSEVLQLTVRLGGRLTERFDP